MDLHSGLKIYQPLPLHEHIIYPNWAFWFENLAILFLGPLCLWCSIHSLCSFSFCRFGKRDRLQSEARFQRLIYTASSPSRKKKKKTLSNMFHIFESKVSLPKGTFLSRGLAGALYCFLWQAAKRKSLGSITALRRKIKDARFFLARQMVIKCTNIIRTFQGPPKYTKIGKFSVQSEWC
jgi:hypothetical protein